MELNINNNLNIDSSGKDNNIIENFMKELSEFLEDKININIQEEELSMIEQVQEEQKVITKYRDEMLLQRSSILNNHAKETAEKGTMYYVYSKNSKDDNIYNLCICEDDKSHEIIEVHKMTYLKVLE